MQPIYEPKGAAREYGELALNIFTGCPHECFYCFAPSVLHRTKAAFHLNVEPRAGIVEATRRQLETEQITGKTIHLCFTCDPYPNGFADSGVTREIIQLLKEHGNHVQILTKGDGSRDFDLLDGNDWYGVTISGATMEQEPFAAPQADRLKSIIRAHDRGIKTWVSFEPVVNAEAVINVLNSAYEYFDRVKIGKLNYHQSDINWKRFGIEVEALCKELGLNYYIKDSLRAEMEK